MKRKTESTGVDIDAVDRIVRPKWEDGTPKSQFNDFNLNAPRRGPNPFAKMKPHQVESLNSRFNVTYSTNMPGALLAWVPSQGE